MKIVPILPQLLNALAYHGTLHAPASLALRGELVLAGFVILTERDPSSGALVAQRPALASSSAALPLRRGTANGQKKAAKAALWALAAASPALGAGSIDPEALLTPEDRARPAACEPGATARGSGPRRRRACKGCTCGLAEELAAEDAASPVVLIDGAEDGVPGARVVDQTERQRLLAAAAAAPKATSSCGNCHLGDAFRCDGCPYLGE